MKQPWDVFEVEDNHKKTSHLKQNQMGATHVHLLSALSLSTPFRVRFCRKGHQ